MFDLVVILDLALGALLSALTLFLSINQYVSRTETLLAPGYFHQSRDVRAEGEREEDCGVRRED